MLRSLSKTFSARSLRYLVKNNGLGSSFSNHRCIIALSTSKAVPKDEKIKNTMNWMQLKNHAKKLSGEVIQQESVKTIVKLTFTLHDGKRLETEAKVGDTLLDVVVNNDLNIEGFGACEGTLTCSTCHVILKQEDYDRLPEEPCDEERDMLDLAYGLTDTSRLGCQITLTKDLDGLEVTVPETINDARS